MSRHRKIDELELTKEEQKLKMYGSVKALPGSYVRDFSGETYDYSVRQGVEWCKRKTDERGSLFEYIPVGYFKQVAFGKSIILSYNLKPKDAVKETENPSLIVS